jgi:predicted AlkP superfamily phosphohydrolase/phosphomutase/tetratricopeptide (TPR) repeat protein
MPERLARKVLLIGWDAADWKIIRPLVARGWMPHLAKLIATGTSGNLASLRPMLSPMLWTSIATGKRPHKHGIHGFTEPRPEGDGIRAVASTSRTTKAVWNILTQQGLRSHCVNWYASHPAEPIDGVSISNRFAVTPQGPGLPWPLADGAVHPPELRDVLARLRVRPEEMDASTLLPFVPGAARIDQAHDKRLLAVAVILAQAATVHGAATWCLAHRPWDFAAVLYSGIDQFCHLFMQYHPPRRAAVSAEDFELYRSVVTGAYRFHDMMLGRLLELAGDDATVLLVSDHGYRPPPPGRSGNDEAPARTLEALALEHRPQGVCVMRGPRVKSGSTIEGATLLDVTPTVLALLGQPAGADMDGRAWVEALDVPGEGVLTVPDPVESWDRVAGAAGLHPADLREPPAESLEAVRHLIELGYIEPPDEDVRESIERTLADNRFNLARSLLDAGQPARAIDLLEALVRDRPAHTGYNAALFEAYYSAGRNAEGRRIAEAMWARGHRGPLAHLAMAAVHVAERKPETALRHLEEAERANPDLPGLHVLTGRAWLRLQQWDRAARAFDEAIRHDADDESAWHGLACAALGRGANEQAAEHALRAVGLRSDYAEAHYHLGVALSRLGRPRDAAGALRRCLSLRPGLLAAYGRLIELYDSDGPLADASRAGELRRRANDLILQRRLRRRFEQLRAPADPGLMSPGRGASGSSS